MRQRASEQEYDTALVRDLDRWLDEKRIAVS
jgi:hypothetical protein